MKQLLVMIAILVVVLAGSLCAGLAQDLKLVDANLFNKDGAPLANQSILIEGTKTPRWSNAWGFVGDNNLKLHAITDKKGYVQMVDMPPGNYTMKLVQPGAVGPPVTVGSFTLKPGYGHTKYDFSAKLDDKWKLDEPPQIEVNPRK